MILRVAVGVLYDDQGRVLLAQRPDGKPYSGYWEFPGGKIEAGESAEQALRRELGEELGIEVDEVFPWLRREFAYPTRTVELNFFRIHSWRGELHGKEAQALAWQAPGAPDVEPMLPPNAPILHALSLPPLMAISAAGDDVQSFLPKLETALLRGTRLVQLREKQLQADAWRAFVDVATRLCKQHNAKVIVNGDIDLALELELDGVQLSARQLATLEQRPQLEWVGASCHDENEIDRAIALGCDYALLSPVLPTATHPDAPGLGWERFAAIAIASPMPIFALGGMTPGLMQTAWRHGAHGVALLRGAWE